MKHLSLVFLLFNLSLLFAQQKQLIVDQFVNDKSFEYAGISVQLVKVETGQIIAAHQAKQSLSSASTAKLFSTASALEILGADYRPLTRIYLSGELDKEGTLNGDIWIRGGGDPTLGSKYFTEDGHERDFLQDWVTVIQQAGVKSVLGSVIADGSAFGYMGVPDGWNWGDIGNYYGAGPAGICLFDNSISFTFTVPSELGMQANLRSMNPEIANYKLRNGILSSSKKGDNAYFYGAPYSFERFARGTLPAGTTYTVKGSIPDPELLLALELKKALQQGGIDVKKEAKCGRLLNLDTKDQNYADKKLIHVHKGASIGAIAKETNYRSINLFAEQLVCLVAYHLTGGGQTEIGLEKIQEYWKTRINTEGLFIADGSGLSRSNAISASHFNELLRYMKKSATSKTFTNTLPVSGTSGTLISFCKDQPAQGKYIAKSGSMNRIRSYAGYLAINEEEYVFSILVNNATCTSSELTKKIERLINQLVQ